MATFIWTLQGTTPTTIDATDLLKFMGASGFDDPITVNAWNDTVHVESSGQADDSSGNSPKNNKFISQAGGTGGDSEVDVGAGTVDLDAVVNGDCSLKINFAHGTTVETSGAIFYVYDGTTTTAAPVNATFRANEQGSANFETPEGSASAMGLADNTTPATSHDFFIVISCSPTAVNEQTQIKYRIELTYF